jgi:hypothetical protein
MAFIRQNFNAENIHKYSSDGARREVSNHLFEYPSFS